MRRYYPYYAYQQGGERHIPGPAAPVPVMPVVTNPRDFARLYGLFNGVGSDVSSYTGVPDRATTDAYLQQELAKRQALLKAVEERKNKSPVTHTPVVRLPNPEVSDRRMRDPSLLAGDMADQNRVLLPSELNAQVTQGLNERQQLENRLTRLGYAAQQAAVLGRRGKNQLHPSLQKQLEDQQLTDYRVMHHPDFDPSRPVEEQQYLNEDDSLRARILRGRNLMYDTGNPALDLAMQVSTFYGNIAANDLFDTHKRFVKPGLAQGALNFGSDVLSLFPSIQGKVASALVSQASPRALEYMAEPFAQVFNNAYKINPWAKGNLFNQWDKDKFYRIVDEQAYEDALKTGLVRSNPFGDAKGAITVEGFSNNIGRPTGFPSFDKGSPSYDYLPKNGKGYIIESDVPMFRRGDVNPVTGNVIKGRHWAYRPIDMTTGEVLNSIPLSQTKFYEPHWLQGYKLTQFNLGGMPMKPGGQIRSRRL